jgi:hypothetical protein
VAKAFSVDGGSASRAVSDPLPDAASFTTAAYANAAGSRDYRLHIPSSRNGERLPLIVMLHGCTQSSDDFAAGARVNRLAEEHGFLGEPYPAQRRQCQAVLELVQARRSAPRLGRAFADLGDHPRRHVRCSIAGQQADLDQWLEEFNRNRPHQGRWCFGKTPMQTFLDATPIAEEKTIAA